MMSIWFYCLWIMGALVFLHLFHRRRHGIALRMAPFWSIYLVGPCSKAFNHGYNSRASSAYMLKFIRVKGSSRLSLNELNSEFHFAT
jgi:hypothetical protein